MVLSSKKSFLRYSLIKENFFFLIYVILWKQLNLNGSGLSLNKNYALVKTLFNFLIKFFTPKKVDFKFTFKTN